MTKSKDLTVKTSPYMPPTYTTNIPGAVREQSGTPARARSVTPATPVSGFGETGTRSRQSPSPAFSLPTKLTPSEIRDNSFKYGGGRSAGSHSLADNISSRKTQP